MEKPDKVAAETIGAEAGKVAASTLAEEIDGAVTGVMDGIKKEQTARGEGGRFTKKAENSADLPPVDEPRDSGNGHGDDPGPEGEPGVDGIPDGLIERAVKAGMTLSEAKEFPSAALLEKMVARIEPKAEKKDEKPPAGDSDDALLAEINAIPDLDPDQYDENIIAGFKAMKSIILKQNAVIREGKSTAKESWFDVQVKSLGEVTPEQRTSLDDKFNVLTAGYKAAGKDVAREAVMKEAVAIVLGDTAGRAADAAKASALERRGTQHINRPNGNRNSAGGGDVDTAVADAVDRKFFGKK